MGLFDFLKGAGSKELTKIKPAKSPETAKIEAEILNKQKLVLLNGIVNSLGIKVENLSMDLNGDKVTIYGQTKTQAEKEKVILAVGNVSGIAQVDDRISVTNPEPEAQFYTVKSGDSLSKIAKNYYGDANKYNVIFEANKPMLKDPNLIYPGQVLRIPAKP